jgi:hypothetical protein
MAGPIEQDAQRSIETAGAAVVDAAMLMHQAPYPIAYAPIAPKWLECLQGRFPVEQPTKSGQIHRLTA